MNKEIIISNQRTNWDYQIFENVLLEYELDKIISNLQRMFYISQVWFVYFNGYYCDITPSLYGSDNSSTKGKES